MELVAVMLRCPNGQSSLKSLVIDSCDRDPGSLIASISSLEELTFSGPEIPLSWMFSDDHQYRLPDTLRHIHFDMTGVTVEQVRQLHRRYPRLAIVLHFPTPLTDEWAQVVRYKTRCEEFKAANLHTSECADKTKVFIGIYPYPGS